MHRIIIVGLAGLAVSGCALPPVVMAVSYATDGVLLATTGKTKTDHIISAGAKQDCSTFRVVQGKEICHEWADGKNPYAEVKDDNSNLAAGSEVGMPIYQATLDNDPFKRPAAKTDAAKTDAAKTEADKTEADKTEADKTAKNDSPKAPAATDADEQKITVAPVTPVAPAPAVGVTAGGSDVIVPVSSSEVSETVDHATTAPTAKAPAKGPANGKKAGGNISKAPAKPAPMLAAAPATGHEYVVLLGSFRSQTNAQRAIRQHRVLKPSIAQADVQGVNYWRVSAGPYSAEKANQLAQKLREDGVRDATVVRETGKSNQAQAAGRGGSQVAALR